MPCVEIVSNAATFVKNTGKMQAKSKFGNKIKQKSKIMQIKSDKS